MSDKNRFALQVGTTIATLVLDTLAGTFFRSPTVVMACWMVLAILVAASFEFVRDKAREHARHNPNGIYSTARISKIVPSFFRSVDDYGIGTIVRSVVAGLFAGVACCALTLAMVTWRFLIMNGDTRLGKGSPLDPRVVAFVSNFQTAQATAVLMVGSVILAIVLKSEFLLPAGILVGSVVNAMQVAIPPVGAIGDGFRSQVAQTLAVLNGYLFRLPPLDVLWGCLIPLFAGLVACGIVAACARA